MQIPLKPALNGQQHSDDPHSPYWDLCKDQKVPIDIKGEKQQLVIDELLKDSSRSDSEIAKSVDCDRTTVCRARKKYLKNQ